MVLKGLLQKLVSLKTLPAIHETSKHMSGLWVNLEMSKDFSILSNRVALGQIFHWSWHLEPIPNAIYDEMTCPESHLGELGQLWVLGCITEDKVGCITVDKSCPFLALDWALWPEYAAMLRNYYWSLPNLSYFQRGSCPTLSKEQKQLGLHNCG